MEFGICYMSVPKANKQISFGANVSPLGGQETTHPICFQATYTFKRYRYLKHASRALVIALNTDIATFYTGQKVRNLASIFHLRGSDFKREQHVGNLKQTCRVKINFWISPRWR